MIVKQRQIPGIVWNSCFKQILVCQTDTLLPNIYMFVLVHVPWSDTKKELIRAQIPALGFKSLTRISDAVLPAIYTLPIILWDYFT